jgi:cytochrome c-type biogenesis protein CcmH/NrfG
MRFLVGAALAFSVMLSASPFAAGGGGGPDVTPPKAVDPNFAQAKAMVEARNYPAAIPQLQQAVAKDPRNADAWNLLGYATRKSGNPSGALQYYNQALQLDPKHLGAHEYVGEAYLMLDQPQQAEQHLARLDQLCIFGCVEYRMLKSAIANYKAGRKPTN